MSFCFQFSFHHHLSNSRNAKWKIISLSFLNSAEKPNFFFSSLCRRKNTLRLNTNDVDWKLILFLKKKLVAKMKNQHHPTGGKKEEKKTNPFKYFRLFCSSLSLIHSHTLFLSLSFSINKQMLNCEITQSLC